MSQASRGPMEMEGADKWLPEIVNHTSGFIKRA